MDEHFVRIQTAFAGRYSLERELGRGGMGVVYLAHEVALDRPVALKLLPPELTIDDAVRERFLREARTAAKLSHPHIVPIYAVDEIDDLVFFAMAAIDGETLGERVRSKGPVSNAEATRLLKELSWALAYAHAQGVVHRDIKPDNILLEEGSGRALLTDFGIAKVRRGDAGSSAKEDAPSSGSGDARSPTDAEAEGRRTLPSPSGGGPPSRTGADDRGGRGEHGGSADREHVEVLERLTQVVGTAEFMSPEQAKGAAVDGRSDLYSLAAVGFFAVSGRAPFEGGGPAEILGRHVVEPAPPLASVVPGVSPVVAGVVDRCLRKDPERRFLGGESIADALTQETVFQRQLPVALRVFIKNLRQLAQSSNALSILFLLALGPALVGLVIELGIPGLWAAGGLVAAVVGAFGASAAWEARKLIKSGFSLEDARLALLEDVNRRNEERRFEVGPRKTRFDTILEWMSGGILGAALVALVAIGVTDVSMSGGLGAVVGWALGGGLTMVLVRAIRAARRADLVGERWLKIWSGKIGDLLYGVGGLGLEPPKAVSASIHRSTEAALGLAAARLFDELPKESKRELGDLPDTVRRLETDAGTLRAQVKELNGVLAELEDEPTDSGAEHRETVRRDVEVTRDAAETRLREVVASLETIRVGLLRMHAGESVVHSVTMDLEAAQELSGDMEGLLEGHREVERLLQERRATGTITVDP